ncbi:phosphate regulon sensor histidine kinase PhoR [Chromobacterium violaceum]|uniref:phosphate regulon sensor histidine kinase PhoR n=1 Tax=Chromobacterium violaceum TaxID=536 RepID=UPI0005D39DA2|nr:phosphate regulon sensor histidine kinase PhoR [Chromobacterium violaceum]KJH66553.1 histidine kinase [Chromobacterium violaceum]KMN50846.1 histidine kinase [Chromobacterium violaceum]KMN85263.1 histidine kinase [Chromobacterium violaceum]KMN89532.1 histidine kinase [Chromobacterium violaceum]KMO03574.1 histidine kinase [Chromobacterium violaceum]
MRELLQRTALWLAAILIVSAGFWALSSATDALLVLAISLGVWLAFNLYHIALMLRWLRHPVPERVPDGFGVWHSVFMTLYRTMRNQSQSKKKLTHALERFINAGEAMPDGVVVLDEHDRIEWVNPMAVEHLGLDRKRDVGNQILNLIRQPAFHTYMKNASFSQPLTLSFSQPRELVISLQLVPFDSTRKLLLTRDITQLERVQTVHRDFVANVSHELRTPLTVVGGFLETLSDMPEVDERTLRQFLPMMMEQSRRMQSLVEDLLTLSRLENSPKAVNSELVDMRVMLDTLMVEAEGLSQGRHQVKLARCCDAGLWGSGQELHSAFGNLVSNAVRYTPEGGSITLSWQEEGEQLRFSVADTGIGIPREHIPRLTERFYRVDRGRSRGSGGTGLGLAIVKHVLARHHARLEIKSEPDKGSTFSVVFPRERRNDSQAA